jgi:hypothetical protein
VQQEYSFLYKSSGKLTKNIALQKEAKKLLGAIGPKHDYGDFTGMEQFNNYN